jgi:L-ascorbate metabolism protein UlaG (beta-lactamase superfamily)
MKVQWLGHSCFKVTHDGYSVVFDPFQPGSVPGLREIRETADLVLCSHGHFDHNYSEGVTIPEDAAPEAFHVTKISVCHDDQGGSLRGMSDILLLEIDDYRIAHFGDIGCELSSEQKALLQNLDLALVPVGGYYTIDGRQAAKMVKELSPSVTIPMHYSGDGFGFDEIDRVATFIEALGEADVWQAEMDTIAIQKGMAPKVVVLNYTV